MATVLRRLSVAGVIGLTVWLVAGRPARLAADQEDPVVQALRQGNLAEARRQALQLAQAVQRDKPRPAQIGVLNKIGLRFKDWADFGDAEQYLLAALRISQNLDLTADLEGDRKGMAYADAVKHLYLSQAEMNLGLLHMDQEDYLRAGQRLVRARREADLAAAGTQTSGRINRIYQLATLEQNQGRLLERMGEYPEAERHYDAALEALGGGRTALPAHLRVRYADVLNSRGWLLATWGSRQQTAGEEADGREKLGRAFADVKASRALWEQLVPHNDARLARSLNNLALLHYFRGEYAEARQLLEESVAIAEDKGVYGPNHPEVARFKHNLAAVLRTQGDAVASERLQRDSLGVLIRAEGTSHPDVGDARAYLAWSEVVEGKWAAAGEEMDQARHIFRQHIRRVLSSQSDAQQLNFLQHKDRAQFHAALALAVRALGGREGPVPADAVQRLTAESTEWLLNGKSVTPEVLAERTVLARQSASSEARATFQELSEVRDELATRSLRLAAGRADGARAEEDLVQREADLSGQLALQLGTSSAGAWVDLAAVQRALAADPILDGQAVLIDIARFEYVDFKILGTDFAGRGQHYAAWVIPPQGAVRVFDLGPAEAIDGAVRRLRKEMEDAYLGPNGTPGEGTLSTKGDAVSEELFRRRSRELADLLLRPMYPVISRYERWVVSPDGDLWLVPWAALVLPGGDKFGAYAVEKHTISFVSSGRDLVAPRPKGVRRTNALIVADADYGKAPEEKRGRLRFGALPLTRLEAKEAVPLLQAYTGGEVVTLLGRDAQEQAFHQRRSPKVVLLGTHGFFLEQAKGLPANPFLRCGLALANANLLETQALAGGSARNDGLLLGQEILDTDLRGTDLVVLSACDTAVGKVRGGEGVANLQSAFRLAGAQSVIATLWEVEELATAQLTRDFFRNLANGKMDKALALREAQRGRIAKLREDGQHAAHPFYWGAMTLTGQWAPTLGD
jgi:CHAT domain-containing protein/tetratricopeptide (TPR) repeat protein